MQQEITTTAGARTQGVLLSRLPAKGKMLTRQAIELIREVPVETRGEIVLAAQRIASKHSFSNTRAGDVLAALEGIKLPPLRPVTWEVPVFGIISRA